MEFARQIILLLIAVAGLSSLARRLGRTAPLVLVVGGVLASWLPFVDHVRISSDVILIGFIPPLLYATAIQTSLIDFAANVRPIGLLSVGLVVFTMLAVGLVAWWLLPIPLAAAFALGAVVAPPDAVAATAVARQVGMPRRAVTILEGESLVNDATAIVCLRMSVAGLVGTVTALEVVRDFGLSVLGGVAVGVAGTFVVGRIRYLIDDVVTDITVSLITPFALYLIAEEVHGSGVLAVVVAGLILGHKSERFQSPQSRIFERGNWATVQFVLENTVFFIVGLSARSIISDVADSEVSTTTIAMAALVVFGAVVAARFVWILPTVVLPALVRRRRHPDAMSTTSGRRPHQQFTVALRISALVGWAGMRGVVTLAAVFVIPEGTPHREVLVLIAWIVAAGTLLIQGSTLPALVRRLGLHGPDPAEDALLEARLLQTAASAGLAALGDHLDGSEPPEVVERLRRRGFERADAQWERLGGAGETPSEVYARLRRHMLDAERTHVLEARDRGDVPDDVQRSVLRSLDIEQTVLIAGDRWNSSDRVDELAPGPARVPSLCDHLTDAAARRDASPSSDRCERCVAEGTTTVHLRMCLACGNVACCDSSVGRHADRHFRESGHPVMRSFVAGEAWRWCYVDDLLG